ncbi:DUF3265 domain-containing protein [Photobacterium sp. MCCC 1A19761]|uniref:hypothetical protein n=1 Tax=Photobacterium sp. MCCC 1A19761 TaxID=3115000 RepID=UPI00307E7EF7
MNKNWNKTITCIAVCFSAQAACAGLYFDYQNQKISFDNISPNLSGLSIGYSWLENRTLYVEADFINDSEFDIRYWGGVLGYNHGLFRGTDIDVYFNFGIGIGELDVNYYQNKNTLISIPLGLSSSYSFTEKFHLDLGIGYRYFIDLTENTKCKDGTTSESTGSGTCSWHGGIARYQDKVGDGGGAFYRAGLRYSF